MYDANLIVQAVTTKTASFTSATVDLKGTPRRGMDVRINVSAASGTTPNLSPKIQHSDDNSAWSDLAVGEQITGVGTSFIPFETDKRYVRLVATIAGTSPSFTYASDMALSRP